MSIESRLAISYYKEIASINTEHGVTLVQHVESGKIYVKKVLTVYNYQVYTQLQNHPIPGIPRIYALHEENGTLTVIEEHISGNTLEELLTKNGPFSERLLEKYMTELCGILSNLYHLDPPVIHRDIKPSNVIVTPGNHIVLLDLNAARAQVSKAEDTVLLGTHGYAAPEQYGFGSSDIKTDIYAIGMLMNTLLWGEFRHEIYPNSKLTAIIDRCTKIDPEERFSSIQELVQSVRHVEKSVVIRSAVNRTNSWKDYLPPGFRTGTIWHMLVAIPVYLFFFWVCAELEVQDVYGAALMFDRVMCFIAFLAVVGCSTNYLGVQRFIPICNSSNVLIRIAGVLFLDFCVILFFLVLIVYMEGTLFR